MSLLKAWNDLLEMRKSGEQQLVGGDALHIEFPEGMFRGPIKDIHIQGNTLVIVNEWTARAPVNHKGLQMGCWEKATTPDPNANVNVTEYRIMDGVMSPPKGIGDGRIYFTHAFARVTLFPQGGSKLHPELVRGF